MMENNLNDRITKLQEMDRLETLETLEDYIFYYRDYAIDKPHKPEYFQISEYIEKALSKINNKNDMETTGICWIATRIFLKESDYICNYANKKILLELDALALEFFKKNISTICNEEPEEEDDGYVL
jgi:hypothetical protein